MSHRVSACQPSPSCNSSNSKIRPALRDAPATGHPRSIPTCVGLTLSEWPMRRRAVHPHVRGAHATPRDGEAFPGTVIPRVGLTTRLTGQQPAVVHPHVRGLTSQGRGGPSTCGLTGRGCGAQAVHQSIPTCVGLTEAYPRAVSRRELGPSPRAWGGRATAAASAKDGPSTCVGSLLPGVAAGSVHPHVRGAHSYLPATLQGVIFSLPPFRDRRHLLFRTFQRR